MANETTIAEELGTKISGFKHAIKFFTENGEEVSTDILIKIKKLVLHPPIGKEKYQEDMEVTVVSAIEIGNPIGRKQLWWTLITNLPISNKNEAIQAIEWYKQRWRIEEYFKILKSGLKTEDSKLRTVDRLSRLIAISCLLAWRIQWITLLNRQNAELDLRVAFNKTEIHILKLYFRKETPQKISDYIILLARLGGYLNRKNDPPPGYRTIWRGFNKLFELCEGLKLAKNVGN